MDVRNGKTLPLDYINFVTLIRYERKQQDEGVTIKRWAGDTSGQYKYVEIEKRKLKLSDFQEGGIPLAPGIYQLKHNSVYGQPPSGFYGQSNFFEVNTEKDIDNIQVLLNPAI